MRPSSLSIIGNRFTFRFRGGGIYKILSSKDSQTVEAEIEVDNEHAEREETPAKSKLRQLLSRDIYYGSLAFNFAAFMLPALYGTLSKLWVANIDSSQVVTTDIYTYIGVIVEVLNEGLPRTAFTVIGDRTTRTIRSRLSLSYTLIIVQAILGIILTCVFLGSSKELAAAFVPREVRETSLTYVRISSVQAFSSAIEVAVASATRALDHPDVPLATSSVKFVVNIILDLLIISKFHVGKSAPTVNGQALIRMACDLTSALTGLVYFVIIALKLQRQSREGEEGVRAVRPSFMGLKTLVMPGIPTFLESAMRNAVYLWLIHGIVNMGSDYATAWGVFNTIRWGIAMVAVQALEASTLTFVGHAWGKWRGQVGPEVKKPAATKKDLSIITRPAWISCIIALAIEIPLCIFLSLWGIKGFAFYLSQSEQVAEITQKMWRTIDWCYIFYALNYQISAILLATTTNWYLLQSLVSNLFWMLPWAIAVTRVGMTPSNAWKYHSVIFGGSLVFSFLSVCFTLALWAWLLTKGKVSLAPVTKTV
ncbi:hypothetical protein VTL71DRAFT_5208 [Oculimacula yallundae]|uniref:Uncharacterized protein n=1 Tax=Oculimacula yallundae TaxID=86028 RepID=A0ABR4C0G4_9HELO